MRLLTVGNGFLSESLPSKSFQSCFPQESSQIWPSNSKFLAIFLWEFLCTWSFFGSKIEARPSVVNCYVGDLGSLEAWFNKWLTFFFDEDVHLDSSGSKKLSSRLIVDLSEQKSVGSTKVYSWICKELKSRSMILLIPPVKLLFKFVWCLYVSFLPLVHPVCFAQDRPGSCHDNAGDASSRPKWHCFGWATFPNHTWAEHNFNQEVSSTRLGRVETRQWFSRFFFPASALIKVGEKKMPQPLGWGKSIACCRRSERKSILPSATRLPVV